MDLAPGSFLADAWTAPTPSGHVSKEATRMSETKASAQARQIVDEFGAAFAKKDFSGARRFLHDDLSFHGPIDTFSRADDYIASITRLGAMMKGLRHEKTIVDGNEVAVFYVLDTALGSAAVADWYTIRDTKIASIRTYFDARPFAPPAGKAGEH
jgi:limonene-1,2-epoxide hydrolase